MKTLKELYDDLEKFKNFDEDESYPENFLNIVDEIVLRKDPSSIPMLLSYFDDDSEYSWVMTSIRKGIEKYPMEDYIMSLILNINTKKNHYNMWADELFNSIFNNDTDLNFFRKNMHLADKASLLEIFDVMEKESPHHAALIAKLRLELNTTS